MSTDAYYIELENDGCEGCGRGRSWRVTARAGRLWVVTDIDTREQASDICEAINEAFEQGKAWLRLPVQ